MARPVKVLHCLGTLDPGGVETWLLGLLKARDRQRFAFDFCTFGNGPGLLAAEAEALGARILRCPRADGLWKVRREFRRILRQGQYDVVHSHVYLFSGMLLSWAKQEGVAIRIAHSHGTCDGNANTLARRAYRRLMRHWIARAATHGLAVSRASAQDVFPGWQTNPRIKILHCAIDLEPFRGAVDRARWRSDSCLSEDAQVIGHVGNFSAGKNQEFLLQILAEIRKRGRSMKLLLVGDGAKRAAIEAQAAAMGIAEQVYFLGTRRDVPELMRTCMDALVFPSRWEGLPLVVLEAQGAGLGCVISSEITEEVIVLGERIVRVPLSACVETWATEVLQCVDRGLAPTEECVRRMERSEFTIECNWAALAEIYEEARRR